MKSCRVSREEVSGPVSTGGPCHFLAAHTVHEHASAPKVQDFPHVQRAGGEGGGGGGGGAALNANRGGGATKIGIIGLTPAERPTTYIHVCTILSVHA